MKIASMLFMKKQYTILLTTTLLLGLSGCDVWDKAKESYESAKEKYAEYHGDGEERPFEVQYQQDPNDKQILISSACGANAGIRYVYYQTPPSSQTVLHDTRYFISTPGHQRPYWDARYVDPIHTIINGSNKPNLPNHSQYTGLDARTGSQNVVIGTQAVTTNATGSMLESECVGGAMAAGTIINLYNAPEQSITYGGPQSTFTYQIGNTALKRPWKSNGDGNLVIQANFKRPLYINFENNIGGSVVFVVFIRNRYTGVILNYIIGLYSAGDAWQREKRTIQFDPTTGFVHVPTVVSDQSWWSTNSPVSKQISEIYSTPDKRVSDNGVWPDFFRVNISYQNLKALLDELAKNPPAGAQNQSFGNDPSQWEVLTIAVQYEVEEQGGKALLSGSFKNFEVYVSHLPI